ncbi:uncharacterized protein LOC124359788 isoform X3 [Homalodisca vitripennis]|uniref:uncharacterized protein LOC124359788 isoform X3 n=1 Tax=Homalodisca vitripennis TaxID=197043 RepID=UPI001EEAF04C|nr:uncharacterized protein LOC124359788 isoform X3 [Homalodisca vitripennis]
MQFDRRPIDFHQLAKPANLSNSAVLRMLEEEEARGRGQGINKSFYSSPFELEGLQDQIEKEIKELGKKPLKEPPDWPPPSGIPQPVKWVLAPGLVKVQPGLKRVTWPPPPEETEFLVDEPQPVYAQAPVAQQATPAQPIQSFQRPSSSPVSFTPPPSTITLRASPPVSQASIPVYASQPITATVKGGARSRGDQKWPPETVKQQAEVENQARIALAKGPAFRPRRVQKDYSSFFAQHALNSTYPGYKAPPGTQHYIEEGTSNL